MSNADTALNYAKFMWDRSDSNTEKAYWYAGQQAYLHALEVDELAKTSSAPLGTTIQKDRLEFHMAQANMWANVAASLRK